jgi:hypothetical protein
VEAARRDSKVPLLLLGVALVISAALLLSLSSGLTFFQDTWAFLMHRRGFTAQAFFEPHNEHIVVIPVILEKLLLTVFGMTSALPEYILLNVLLAVTAVLLFVYVRRRLGSWPALFAAVLVLFLGPAWQVLLWPFEVALVGSTMTGIAVLLVLEREDRAGDIRACLLVLASIAFSSLGLAFAVGAGVDVLQRRRSLGLRRLYVPGIPVALYAVWYAAYGHEAQSAFSLHNVLHSPVFVAEGLSASVGALGGLSTLSGDPQGRPYLGFLALVVVVALIAYSLWRRRAVSSRFWPAAASAATFWVLAAFNRSPGREAPASRYMHIGGILILLIAADLLKGVRFGTRALVVAGLVVLAAAAINVRELQDGSDYLGEQTVLTRADIGAMEIASRTILPSFALTPTLAGTPTLIDVNAAEYFPAEREYGSPAYSPRELADAPEPGRRQADVILAQALPISTVTHLGTALGAGARDCVVVPGGSGADGREVRLSPGLTRIGVAPGPHASFALRRFAVAEYPVITEGASGESVTVLRIPRDRARQPWFLRVEAAQAARVCR